MSLENDFERYLQSHVHPDVQPSFRREIRLGTVSLEGFLRLAGHFQANHEAFDAQLEHEGAVSGFDSEGQYIQTAGQQELTFTTQDLSRVDL